MISRQFIKTAFFISLIMLINAQLSAQEPKYIWLEAESPVNDIPSDLVNDQAGELISNGSWIIEALSKEDIEAGKLHNGRYLKYQFSVQQEGAYKIWLRLGYESVRAPVLWRIDDGEWQELSPDGLTLNLIELSFWFEIGWISPAEVNLMAGSHTLEIKAEKPESNDRFLFALDAIAFVQGNWTPEDKLKPGEVPNTEIDRQASEQVFKFPTDIETESGKRVELSLNGLWQVCRHDDPDMDSETYEPVRSMPDNPRWRGISVPSNLRSIPALDMAHRVWYRCRVDVPKSLDGRSFFLDLSGTNWIASVVVNGEFIGWRKSTRIPWQLDITGAVRPGQINEIWIGIKDVWYSIDANFHKKSLDELRNIPVDAFRHTRFVAPVYPSTKGDADGRECGITDPISIVVAGAVYVEDVFVKTRLSNKIVEVDYTLRNTTKTTAQVELQADFIFEVDNQVEQSAKSGIAVSPEGKAQIKLTGSFLDPKLWFPGDDPANMYHLVSKVKLNGETVDIHEQRFGFCEVSIDGIYIRVNGLRRNFWNLLDVLKGSNTEEILAHFRKGNNRFERFSEDLRLRSLLGIRRKQLNWCDTHGVPGRLSTMIDGMFINYDLSNPVVWENFREHVQQVVMAYRNHPSIIVYSLENELVLINGRLGYGGILDQVEAEAKRLVDIAHEFDPMRPCMLDGAGALKDNSLEINCLHYPEPSYEFFPLNAYTLERWGGFGERWAWDYKRPLVMGETAFMAGRNSEHAWIGGDRVFLSRYEAKRAYAKYVKILIEGYRWSNVAMICPWIGMDDFPECWNSMSPISAFVFEYNTGFLSGSKAQRTVKVFNDTFSDKPVQFAWEVRIGQEIIAGDKTTMHIEPGFSRELTVEFPIPEVQKRTEASLILKASQEGEKPFEDVKDIAFFPRIAKVSIKRPVFILENNQVVTKFISHWGVNAKPISEISDADPAGIVIIEQLVLTDEQAKSDDFLSYARNGGRIICLEQEHPFASPTVNIKTTDHQAYFAFPLGIDSPLLSGLKEQDFSNWAGYHPTAERLWEMSGSSSSARSWIVCGRDLRFSTMLEIPAGQGVIIASQMRIGDKLAIEPSTQVLLANALRYCDTYEPPSAKVTVFAPQRSDIVDFVRDLGCAMQEVSSLQDTITLNGDTIAIIHASKANLESLLKMKDAVDRFAESGGWVLLWGLEPDGLESFNALLGTKHLLREFRLERVSLLQDMLTAGLGNRDVLQYSDEEIMHGDKWLSQEVFTYCVDGADIAPFCKLPGQTDEPYRPTKDDHDPYNLVNSMTGNDFWRYILQIWHGNWSDEGSPPFTFRLPVPCSIRQVKIWNNNFYDTIKDIEIKLDGRMVTTLELPDAMAPAEADLNGTEAQESLSLIIRSIRKRQDRHPLVGIDNVQIIRDLPDWYNGKVFPLVNVGGLVRYPRGKGGFVLNQLKLNPQDMQENIAKKKRILGTILLNMGAKFAEPSE